MRSVCFSSCCPQRAVSRDQQGNIECDDGRCLSTLGGVCPYGWTGSYSDSCDCFELPYDNGDSDYTVTFITCNCRTGYGGTSTSKCYSDSCPTKMVYNDNGVLTCEESGICNTEGRPTRAPTAPTISPTSFPTAPTKRPTSSPTAPTRLPTRSPTAAVTAGPTQTWSGAYTLNCVDCKETMVFNDVTALTCSCRQPYSSTYKNSVCYSSCCPSQVLSATYGSLQCAQGDGTCLSSLSGVCPFGWSGNFEDSCMCFEVPTPGGPPSSTSLTCSCLNNTNGEVVTSTCYSSCCTFKVVNNNAGILMCAGNNGTCSSAANGAC